ncbi:MAG: hypothetical protein PWQ87_73 [Candidatus Woesearchaeota archaeon]|nr:hypothetical protein [Candidatus Woesearchaeota archaeon]
MVASKTKNNGTAMVFKKDKVVGTFMLAGMVAVFLAFYNVMIEFFMMPKALAWFIIALLFFLLALMFNVAEGK